VFAVASLVQIASQLIVLELAKDSLNCN